MTPSPAPINARYRLGKAAVDAVVRGLSVYGPHVVGLSLFAVPTCALCAFAHFVLGISALPTVGGAAVGTLVLHGWRQYRDR